jgi:hypothetical protein
MSTPLFHPRTDRWADHYAWNDDFTRIVALAPSAKATVENLLLDRPEVINLMCV